MSGKRSIFEEVGSDVKQEAAMTGVIDQNRGAERGKIRLWLMVLFTLVALMIVVGGLTRLTDSGLSITEWKPVTGAVPPMSAEAWQSEFEKYQQIPEFKDQNSWMKLDDFKTIYWWEWGHRQLGRVIGLVWALGFAWFTLRKQVPGGWNARLLLIGCLGAVQGAIGWWMVSSGLGHGMLDVASYRLATHLGLAFVILGFITWYVLMLGREDRALLQARRGKEPRLFSMSTGLMHFAMWQILLGALVAGIDAGRNYVDWPLMAGQVFPPDPFEITPWWRNFFENAGLVQFIHRFSGYLLVIFGVIVWRRSRGSAHVKTRFAFNLVLAMMVLQMVIGIMTVLYAAQLHVAITHQIGAIVLWVLILNARFNAYYPQAKSIRETI